MLFLLIRKEIPAVSASAIQNACHTPTAPKMRLRIKAAGRIMIKYRHNETTREAVPFPRPSSAPQAVTDTEETRKPAQMIRSAVFPAWIVDGFVVNIPMSCPGTVRQMMVPISMITPLIQSVT